MDSTQPLRPQSERGTFDLIPETYGRSVAGTALEVFLPPQKPIQYLLLAAHHGDEPETTVLLSTALRSILPAQLASAVVLAVNPDALARGTRGNLNGVDLNRNFPTKDWSPAPVHHRWHQDSDPRAVALSPGSAPLSEPENQALVALVKRLQPKMIVTFHAPLACVDDPADTPLGRLLSDMTGLPHVADVGYATPGSFGTWAQEQGQPLITFELGHESIRDQRTRLEPAVLALLRGEI
ncbi:protein MpaA [Catalinimonas alkaloidigena]|uniref:Protein MpaA n=1 Tax=Catalinimonas alkaloidigena TaxID=1075417 RepID=A0A1G9EI43_9BACT|nr:murein tripeptide amidase MpaA [Catalinimonas alkaloidigena]SDK75809.1 protein MpaA [Catalinimonas alkaloidigena]